MNNASTGGNNTALGYNTLLALTTGSSNIAVGSSAGSALTTGSLNIDIGNNGVAGESKTIRIGKSGTQTSTIIAGITGTTVAGGVGVIIGSNGKLGTVVSSARFKEAIKPMDKASEAILALKPVTFRYKNELDPDGIPQFGLVAEQVEKVNPDLVARDEQGKPYTVRYEAVNAMLLNEFLKEHRKVEDQNGRLENQARKIEEQEAVITQLKREMGVVTARLKEQDSKIQKVSAQIELSKPAPQMVDNNPASITMNGPITQRGSLVAQSAAEFIKLSRHALSAWRPLIFKKTNNWCSSISGESLTRRCREVAKQEKSKYFSKACQIHGI